MGIKGDVRSLSLANVLQDLKMNEQTGTLRIHHKERTVALWFEKGGLRLVGLAPREGPSLLNGLLALEKIRPEDLPAQGARQPSEGGLVRGLVKKGRLAKADLKAALEHQMSEHLCDAFLWTEATFDFEEGEPDDRAFDVDQLDLEARLAVDAVIMEALRRADEWGETRKAILSSSEILVPDPGRLPADADGTTKRVFALLDGERTLREVEELTRLGHFVLLRSAALLMRSGAARPLAAPEAFERARARASRKEWGPALKMCRYGLDHERKNTGLLELALKAAEALEDHEDAASFARQLASAQAESGHHEAAISGYQKVLLHAPRDLTAHERLLDLLLGLDLKLDALAQGEALAAAYKKAGLPDKALDVYKRLIEKVGDQRELLESVAEIQRHLGDKKEAVALYRKLLAGALEAKDDPAALDLARTLLKLDPHNEEALKLRQQLESGEVERTRRRRRAVRGLVAGAAALALLAVAVTYESRARAQYGLVRTAITDAVVANNYRKALSHHDSVFDGWRWSLIARELRQERDDLEKRYVEKRMEEAGDMEGLGFVTEAIQLLEEARPAVRNDARMGPLDAKLVKLRQARSDAERDWVGRLAKMEPARIREDARHPLAVQALEKLLGHEKPELRAAAIDTLVKIKGDAVIAVLVRALAIPDVAARAAAEILVRDASPFRAELVFPRGSFRDGELLPLEWRVVNVSPAELDLVIEPPSKPLRVEGPGGALKLPPVPTPGRRAVRLGPGEYWGAAMPEFTRAVAHPGVYTATWTAAVTWNNARLELRAPLLSIERSR